MAELIPLLVVAALILYIGAIALVRWRRGKRPLVTSDDYACGCALVGFGGAVVGFAISLWWLDDPWWLAVLVGLGVAVIALLYGGEMGMYAPDKDREPK